MLLFLFACVTGNNYPSKYAAEACDALYTCVDSNDIEDYLGYNDQADCADTLTSEGTDSDDYKDYSAGNLEFNKENADDCLSELVNVKEDSGCNGSMSVIDFALDAYAESCGDVYQ